MASSPASHNPAQAAPDPLPRAVLTSSLAIPHRLRDMLAPGFLWWGTERISLFAPALLRNAMGPFRALPYGSGGWLVKLATQKWVAQPSLANAPVDGRLFGDVVVIATTSAMRSADVRSFAVKTQSRRRNGTCLQSLACIRATSHDGQESNEADAEDHAGLLESHLVRFVESTLCGRKQRRYVLNRWCDWSTVREGEKAG